MIALIIRYNAVAPGILEKASKASNAEKKV